MEAAILYWPKQRSENARYTACALELFSAEDFSTGEHEYEGMCKLMVADARAVLCYDCSLEENLQDREALLCNMRKFDLRQGRNASTDQEISEA